MAYRIPEIFRQGNVASSRSTVLVSHRLHDLTKQRMIFFEVNVENGFEVPEPLPYGVFAEVINKGQANESVLQVWVAPGYYSNNVSFPENCERVFNYSEYIKEADVCTQVVLKDSLMITDADTWEAEQEVIDQTHSLNRIVKVVTTNPITEGEWDDELNASHQVTRELVKASVAEADGAFPSGLVSVLAGYNFIQFQELRCGWYLKRTELMSTSDTQTFGTTRSYFWPAVLETGIEIAALYGDKNGTEYVASQLIDARYKESYNGPCKTEITKAWTNSAPSAQVPVGIMITDAFQYHGIFFNYSNPECLHPSITFEEFVGDNHPVLLDRQVRTKTFPGTDKTDWSDFVEFYETPRMYKGGWLTTKVKIFKPGT